MVKILSANFEVLLSEIQAQCKQAHKNIVESKKQIAQIRSLIDESRKFNEDAWGTLKVAKAFTGKQ